MSDPTHGYEAVADEFLHLRSSANAELIADWAANLSPRCDVLDVGAGSGWPVTTTLVAADHKVWAIEPSPTLARAFQERLPGIPLDQNAAQQSAFLDQKFDAVVAVGLIFLLSERAQYGLTTRMADALRPNGQLLFSAPAQVHQWDDTLTGRASLSLGRSAYEAHLTQSGLTDFRSEHDENGNHFLIARKTG